MSMKTRDLSVAVSLALQGYLRANGEEGLKDALGAIRQEAHDWAENLKLPDGVDGSALEPDDISDGATSHGGVELSRTPYNLVSLAISALAEAIDLAGPESVHADFGQRFGVVLTEAPAA